jgi:hypothetical protein
MGLNFIPAVLGLGLLGRRLGSVLAIGSDRVAASPSSAHFIKCQIAGIAGEIGAFDANFVASRTDRQPAALSAALMPSASRALRARHGAPPQNASRCCALGTSKKPSLRLRSAARSSQQVADRHCVPLPAASREDAPRVQFGGDRFKRPDPIGVDGLDPRGECAAKAPVPWCQCTAPSSMPRRRIWNAAWLVTRQLFIGSAMPSAAHPATGREASSASS